MFRLIPNGEGANLAMYDSTELGKASVATEGATLQQLFFGDKAPQSLVGESGQDKPD